MRISRTTIDKLGIKLYDSPAAVTAELIANSYDADATKVTVHIPLGQFLAANRKAALEEFIEGKPPENTSGKGLAIVVEDNGHGMTPDEANRLYLQVGTDRRAGGRKTSRDKKRKVMGRKGIGKLAPFGICRRIEVWSAGGEKGVPRFRVTHFALQYEDIRQETDEDYHPEPLADDGKWVDHPGTKVTLKQFGYRRTPDMETFHRQLARRFGIQQSDFKIEIKDTVTGESKEVGDLDIETMAGTKINVDNRPVVTEEGESLPVRGWVAFAKRAYPNPEVAGIRIYARGKFVANPRDFGIPAGFTGEYTVRSYLVGAIHCDWLDEDDFEDLVQTGRQDILWTSERGRALEAWGRALVKEIGEQSRAPRRETVAAEFLEKSAFETRAARRFPGNPEMQKAAIEVGRLVGGLAERDDFEDPHHLENLAELALNIAPHKMLVDAFQRLAEVKGTGLAPLIAIFRDVNVAEATSLGQIALEKIKAIKELEERIDGAENELQLQELLEGAPWLINAQWTLLGANVTFDTLRTEFEKWAAKKFGKPILTTTLSGKQRPDFVLLHIGHGIEDIEIKMPGHAMDNKEMARIHAYIEALDEFLQTNKAYAKAFPDGVHVTLVCDEVSLSGVTRTAYNSLVKEARLNKHTWKDFLLDAKTANQEYWDLYRKGKVTKL